MNKYNRDDLILRFMSGIYGFNYRDSTLIADYILNNYQPAEQLMCDKHNMKIVYYDKRHGSCPVCPAEPASNKQIEQCDVCGHDRYVGSRCGCGYPASNKPEQGQWLEKEMKRKSIDFFREFHHPDCGYDKKYTNTCTCGLNDNVIAFCSTFSPKQSNQANEAMERQKEIIATNKLLATPPQKAALEPLDKQEVFEVVRANNNTFVTDTDCRYIAKFICERFGTPQRAVVGVEYIMDIISKIEMEHKLKVYDMRDAKVIAKAIHEALIQDKK